MTGDEAGELSDETEEEILNDKTFNKYLENIPFAIKKPKRQILLVSALLLVTLLTTVILLIVLLSLPIPIPNYPTYEQILKKLNQLVQQLTPHIQISTHIIGWSVEEREILLLKMSQNSSNFSMSPSSDSCLHPLVWVVCGVHGREWTSPFTCLEFIEKLGDILINTEGEEEGDDILRSMQYNILVLANPDGYQYSMSLPNRRLARKNRGRSSCPDSDLAGVDINRNFGVGFNHGDDCYGQVCPFNATPCSITHGGVAPFSEPETRAIRDAMTAELPWLSLSLHGNGNSWSSPFAYKIEDSPSLAGSKWDLQFLADKILGKFGTSYLYGSSAGVMYRAGGTMVDWVYEELGVVRSYNHELRNLCGDKIPMMEEMKDKASCIFQPEVQLALDYIVPEAWFGFRELLIHSYKQDCEATVTS